MASHLLLFKCLTIILTTCIVSANKTFIPTDSWKTVEEGETIPPGLHVRINLETGKKEAKLLDKGESKKEGTSSLVALKTEKDGVELKPDELKRLLKSIKNDDGNAETNEVKKFRSYDEIKKEFEKVQMNVKSDTEILKSLVNEFRSLKNLSGTDELKKLLALLSAIEYLVHQYDNAVEFAQLNGFSVVVLPCMNVTDHSEVRSEALKVLGSATQSNPFVQRAAVNSGCVGCLLKTLALETNPTVRSTGLFALSCLIRSFPTAQLKFVQEGGISVLSSLFDNPKDHSIRVRIARLLTDLLVEMYENVNSPKRKEHYELINLDLNLREQGWCKRSADWLCGHIRWEDVSEMQEDQVDHQVIEVAVDFLQPLSETCLDDFVTNIQLMNVVNHVKQFYSDLALREMDDGVGDTLYSDIYSKLRNFAATLARTTLFKDEL